MLLLLLDVRSQARRRDLAVARREGSGSGGLRAVVRVVRKLEDGVGSDCARMAARSCEERSMENDDGF